MNMHRVWRLGILAVGVAALVLAGAGTAFAQMAPGTSIDGTIVSVGDGTVTLTVADGTQQVANVSSTTLILGRQTATLDEITTGEALGIAAHRDSDGNLVADSINIFAPAMWDVVRKGQFPMNNGDIMTNAMVDQSVQGMNGRVLTMKLAERNSDITVPDGTQIHRLVSVMLSDLTPGLHILVRGTQSQDGTWQASAINFEEPETKG